MIENVEALPPYKLYAPQVEGAEEFIVSESWKRAKELYGDPLPEIVCEAAGKGAWARSRSMASPCSSGSRRRS